MSGFLPTVGEKPPPLHSLVAWPPEALDTWMRRTQARLGVSGFGLPHLNIRAPFQTSLSAAELTAAFRDVLRDQTEFEVQIKGWKRLPNVLFLQCGAGGILRALHERALEVGPSSRAPYDGPDFVPHLTLALGVLPCAEDELWTAVQDLRPPVSSFTVQALSLTREERGEVQELHTFPLLPVGAPREPEFLPAGAEPS